MIYRLLGEFRIGRDDRLVRLPGGHALLILTALALNANRVMRKDDLIRLVWPDAGVEIVQLHKQISMLRKLLATIDREADLKTRGRVGYELRIDPHEADWLSFKALLDETDTARNDHRGDDEIALLRRALGLWTGPHPLVNVPTEDFQVEVGRLEQRRRRAATRLFEWELAHGRAEDILDDVSALFDAYPSDRRLCGQLMVAAYRADQEQVATSAYVRHREVYADEFGQKPDGTLRTLHFAIANGDASSIAEASAPFVAPTAVAAHTAAPVPRQLPADHQLIGRDDLAAEVSWLLTRERVTAAPVIVISGPGGIGKTTLALSAAYRSVATYPDGQLYAQLRDTAGAAVDSGEILAQFLRALGAENIPEENGERGALYRTLTADLKILVLLDDARTGRQVSDLVPGNPQCAVVVTARRRLPDVSGAHHVAPLEPLQAPIGELLFRQVVSDAGITLADDDPGIGEVVDLCGGLPLALRIAGALRVHDHPQSTAVLAARLARQGLPAFAYGELDVARTIGAGFDRLDPVSGRLMLGLGLLRLPTFARWTAESLLDGIAADPMVPLSQLNASFMIDATSDEPRYRFHDLTWEWAEKHAYTTYPAEAVAMATAAYTALLTLVRHAHTSIYGGAFDVVHSDVPDWTAPVATLDAIAAAPLAWFEAERSNIRAAVEHCAVLGLTDICWDLAVSTHEFYTIRGYFDDWYATHATALHACRQVGNKRGEGIVLACLGQPALVSSRRNGVVSGPAELELAVTLLTEAGDRHGQAIAMRTLANALRRRAHLTRPLALFQAARERYQASGDTPGSWQALRFIGQSYLDLGHFAHARRVLEEAGRDAEAIGNQRLLAQTRYWIGQACLALGDLAGAEAAFGAMLDVFGDQPGIGQAYARHGLGDVAARHGRHREAKRDLDMAVEMARSGADAMLEGRIHLSVAALHRDRGRARPEIGELVEAVSIFAGCGAVYLEVRALAALGTAQEKQGDTAAADAAWASIDDLYAGANVPDDDRVERRARA